MKVLVNGRAFIGNQLKEVEIGFDEKIRTIGADLTGEKIDCSGKIILPAAIDVHVHFRDFNQAHKEDWQTGSRAAVKGGVATVMEMPNTDPPTITLEIVRKKRVLAEKSLVNFGLYGGIAKESIENIEELAKEVDAFKLYMGETTGGLHITDPKLQTRVFKLVAQTGKILTVHAQRGGAEPKKITEAEAYDLENAINMAVRFDTKLHLAHVTTLKGVEMIVEAKKDGIDVTCETCPHYLFFTQKDAEKRGAFLKVNPPLATEEDRRYLWEEALPKGFIDMIASDHAPHTIEEKSRDIEKAPAGVPAVEMTLPLLLDAVNHKKLALAKLIELCCVNPAKRFDFLKKGKIAPDYDADLVVVDMSLSKEVKREELATKCGWSPFEGFKLQGWPVMTIVKGNVHKLTS